MRLVVENGGRRLDPAAVGELAEPFRRLGADRTGSDSGSGLGLSIVAAIAEAHRGIARPRGARRPAGCGSSSRCPSRRRARSGRRREGARRRGRPGARRRHRRRAARPGHGRRRRLRRPRGGGEARRQRATTSSCSTATFPGVHGDALCRMIADRREPVDGAHAHRLGRARRAGERARVSVPTTTSPSRSTSPSSCCGCAPSPAASPTATAATLPGGGHRARPARATPPPATAGRSSCP